MCRDPWINKIIYFPYGCFAVDRPNPVEVANRYTRNEWHNFSATMTTLLAGMALSTMA